MYVGVPDRFYGVEGTFDYVRCQHCGLLQIREVPADLSSFYADYSLHSGGSLGYRLFARFVLRRLYPLAPGPGRILDIGCGDGWYLEEMRRRGWQTFGYEYDHALAERLTSRLQMPVLAGEDSLRKLESSFDLITFNFSWEHLTEPRRFLDLARDLLVPGGRVSISVPNPDGREARLFRSRWHHLDPPRHIALYGKQQLTSLLQHAGFANVRTRDQALPTGFAGSISYALVGRMQPLLWYAGILPGFLFCLVVPDGNYSITGEKT